MFASKRLSLEFKTRSHTRRKVFKQSLRNLFSPGLIRDAGLEHIPQNRSKYLKAMVIKNALSAVMLDN